MRGASGGLVLVAVAVALCWDLAFTQQQGATDKGHDEIQVATRFAGLLRPTTATGVPVPLHVEFKEWRVTRRPRGIEFPVQGFYIAHLFSGVITTEIAGKSVLRSPGDFWTVSDGVRMVVTMQEHHEAAIIQTLVVSPAR